MRFSTSVTAQFYMCKPMPPSLVSCPFLAYFQSVIPVLSLLGCRVVGSAAEADRRHLCWYGTIVVVVLKWSWGAESIGFSTLFIAVAWSRTATAKQLTNLAGA